MITKESKVTIHYTLKVEGEVVDSSIGGEPLEYVHGIGMLVPGLEEQIEGLKKGDKKSVSVAPEKGYGVRDERLMQQVPRTAFKDSSAMKIGDMIQGQAQGQMFEARVTALSLEQVTLDLNHPLAGKTLNFEIEVVNVA